ncbi:putative periplasmic serine endoprotease DegP-like precursor [Planctopirus ephydatiae]|uniref:Putative periplasmic serine endoprotease DegP-like n=1 Tax=Planctopirus ephydatiae TaxID=2528019 RepID=A0A518GME6_9PLAN|nr:serine protease [Planctopirus ephydatiae]QDV29822.1 putative periplasmic serine endoprotease DegP-like precursor [Planctopirus ephydatiae]
MTHWLERRWSRVAGLAAAIFFVAAGSWGFSRPLKYSSVPFPTPAWNAEAETRSPPERQVAKKPRTTVLCEQEVLQGQTAVVQTAVAQAAVAQTAEAAAEAGSRPVVANDEPVFLNDEELSRNFERKAILLAKAGQCLSSRDMKKQLERRQVTLELPPPRTAVLSPEEVYRLVVPSTLLIGSLQQTRTQPPRFHYVSNATAWVLAADGVIVTNYHVFDTTELECFAVMTLQGDVYPVTEILAADRRADVAIARITAKDLTPIPLGKSAAVGAWVGALTHPGSAHFMFTQGYVTRYQQIGSRKNERPEKWMSISADYAIGSSGGPILDRYGNVVGMASMTEPVEFDTDDTADVGSTLQMILKLTVPQMEIRRLVVAP